MSFARSTSLFGKVDCVKVCKLCLLSLVDDVSDINIRQTYAIQTPYVLQTGICMPTAMGTYFNFRHCLEVSLVRFAVQTQYF